MQKFVQLCCIALTLFLIGSSCSKNNKDKTARVQVRLTDNPPANVKEVWVDVQQVEIIVNDGAPVLLPAAHPGLYNLLELTNGKDTLLADAVIPAGNISQIRLILGANNYIITNAGQKLELKTPSAQQSGLKVQVHQNVEGGILYRLVLDFDVARSLVEAGNSGNIILKPVLRLVSFLPSGGDLRGIVLPGTILSAVYAINGTDTVATAYTSLPSGGFYIKDIPAGNYQLSYVPADPLYHAVQKAVVITAGKVNVAETVVLVP